MSYRENKGKYVKHKQYEEIKERFLKSTWACIERSYLRSVKNSQKGGALEHDICYICHDTLSLERRMPLCVFPHWVCSKDCLVTALACRRLIPSGCPYAYCSLELSVVSKEIEVEHQDQIDTIQRVVLQPHIQQRINVPALTGSIMILFAIVLQLQGGTPEPSSVIIWCIILIAGLRMNPPIVRRE